MTMTEWWMLDVRRRNLRCRGSPRDGPYKRPPSLRRRCVLTHCGVNPAMHYEGLKGREVIV